MPSALLAAALGGRQTCLDLLLSERPGDVAVTNWRGMNAAHLVAMLDSSPQSTC